MPKPVWVYWPKDQKTSISFWHYQSDIICLNDLQSNSAKLLTFSQGDHSQHHHKHSQSDTRSSHPEVCVEVCCQYWSSCISLRFTTGWLELHLTLFLYSLGVTGKYAESYLRNGYDVSSSVLPVWGFHSKSVTSLKTWHLLLILVITLKCRSCYFFQTWYF